MSNENGFLHTLRIKMGANVPLIHIFTHESRRLGEMLHTQYHESHHILTFSSASGWGELLRNGTTRAINLNRPGAQREELTKFETDPYFKQIAELLNQGRKPAVVLNAIREWVPMGSNSLRRKDNPKPTLFLLYNFDTFFEGNEPQQATLELYDHLTAEWTDADYEKQPDSPGVGKPNVTPANARTTVLFISPMRRIPQSLSNIITPLELPLPNDEEVTDLVDFAISEYRKKFKELPEKAPDSVYTTLKGLTRETAGSLFNESFVLGQKSLEENIIVPHLIKGKQELMKHSGILTYILPRFGMAQVGGLDNVKAGLKQLKNSMSLKGKQYGIPGKRAFLFCGVPGGGKSALVEAVGHDHNLVVLRFDMGSVMNKFVGESEARMDLALQQVVANAPCLLWIDEINRQASDGANGDSGVSDRLKGKLLTFMQECEEDVIIIATGNDVSRLAPELMSRFNVIYFFDLPTEVERAEIFKIHIEKVRVKGAKQRNAADFDIKLLARASQEFTGREIEKMIVKAMEHAFAEDREYTTDDIVAEIATTISDYKRQKYTIDQYRDWAFTKCEPATTSPEWEAKKESMKELLQTEQATQTKVDQSRFSNLN